MDNLARHYKSLYEEAQELAAAGMATEARNICWRLRLRPDLELYRPGMVNLLIAGIVPKEKAKYAQECLDLFETLRQERRVEAETLEEELAGPEAIAHRIVAAGEPSQEAAMPSTCNAPVSKSPSHPQNSPVMRRILYSPSSGSEQRRR